ncbi:MAG: Clp protease N-terminal domain-containing protein [Gaiellales bacterium]
MFERFTERARQVVVLAQDEARALRHHYIGSEHLLLGLMREEPGVAARVLGEAGVDANALRDHVRAVVGEGDGASPGQLAFSPGAKAALEAGLKESLDVGHNFIGTEHILLGILRNPEPQVTAVLAAAGVDVGQLVASAEQALPGQSIVEIAPDIMGFERLTEFARGAIVHSQDEARSLNHNYVGTEHILLGLLREEQGGAAQALHAGGVSADAARDQVRQTVGTGDDPVVGQIPFTPHARRILALARAEATGLNHWSVGTEHLLLGLIGKHGGVATEILEQLGAEPGRIRDEVHALLAVMVFERPQVSPEVAISCPACGEKLAGFPIVWDATDGFRIAGDHEANCSSCGARYRLHHVVDLRPA